MCNLKKLRRKKKISLIELSEALKIPKPFISMWEKDKCIPDKKYAIQIADYFNVSIEDLFK